MELQESPALMSHISWWNCIEFLLFHSSHTFPGSIYIMRASWTLDASCSLGPFQLYNAVLLALTLAARLLCVYLPFFLGIPRKE